MTKLPNAAFAPLTLPTDVNVSPRIVPLLAYTLPAVTLFVTDNDDNVPTLVIFGCAAVVNVPVNNDAPIVPLLAYTLPAVILFVIDKLLGKSTVIFPLVVIGLPVIVRLLLVTPTLVTVPPPLPPPPVALIVTAPFD